MSPACAAAGPPPAAVHLLNAGGGPAAAHAGLTYYAYAFVSRASLLSGAPQAADMSGRASKVFVGFSKTNAPRRHRLGAAPAGSATAGGRGGLLDALGMLLLRPPGDGLCLRAQLQRAAYCAGETLVVDVRVDGLGGPARVSGLRVTLKQVVQADGQRDRIKTTVAAWQGGLPGAYARVEVPLAVPEGAPARLAVRSVFPRQQDHALAASSRGALRVQYYVNVHLVHPLAPHTSVRLFFALLPAGTALVSADESAAARDAAACAPRPAVVSFGGEDIVPEDAVDDPSACPAGGPAADESLCADPGRLGRGGPRAEPSGGSDESDGGEERRAPSHADTLSPSPCMADAAERDVDLREASAACARLRALLGKAAPPCADSAESQYSRRLSAQALRAALGTRRREMSGEMLGAIAEASAARTLGALARPLSVAVACHAHLAPIAALEAGPPLDARLEAAARVLDDYELAVARAAAPRPCDEARGRVCAGLRGLCADVPGYAACADALRSYWLAMQARGLIEGGAAEGAEDAEGAEGAEGTEEAHAALADLLPAVVALGEPSCTSAPLVLAQYAAALGAVVRGTPASDALARAAYWQWHMLAAVVRAHLGAEGGVRAAPRWTRRGAVPRDADRPAAIPLLADCVIDAMQQL